MVQIYCEWNLHANKSNLLIDSLKTETFYSGNNPVPYKA